MTLPYLGRLICLCLAAFFLIYTASAALVSLAAGVAVRRAAHMRAQAAARLVFGIRLLPAAVAGLLVAGLCVPSYLIWEPRELVESLGPACLMAALLGAIVCASGLVRGVMAAIRSTCYLRACQNSSAPVLLVTGMFRPRLFVSPSVREALPPEEFEAALRHEEGHREAQDNLKRLLILISPDIFPFVHGFDALETAWRRLSEFAADDWAAAGSPDHALVLASALVRVGRMRAGLTPLPVGTSLLADTNELGARVQRLMGTECSYQPAPRILVPALAGLAAAAVLGFQLPVWHAVYGLLEWLAH